MHYYTVIEYFVADYSLEVNKIICKLSSPIKYVEHTLWLCELQKAARGSMGLDSSFSTWFHVFQIVHKRLSARNVLLAKTLGGYVAKLIGFGPSNADKGTKTRVKI